MVSVIVATDENNVIGYQGDMPWHGQLPADLTYFAQKTTGQAVIMGRTTYLSIPVKYRPLPNRLNLVLSAEPIEDDGVKTFQSLQSAIDYGARQEKEVFIAGGGSVYKEALSGSYEIDRVFRTLIKHHFDGDTFFPKLGNNWQLKSEECRQPDDKNKYAYCFQTYERAKLPEDTHR